MDDSALSDLSVVAAGLLILSPTLLAQSNEAQEYRYDISRQHDASETVTSNFGASRGLEIIPTTRLEIGISPPPSFTHRSDVPDGFGDVFWPMLELNATSWSGGTLDGKKEVFLTPGRTRLGRLRSP